MKKKADECTCEDLIGTKKKSDCELPCDGLESSTPSPKAGGLLNAGLRSVLLDAFRLIIFALKNLNRAHTIGQRMFGQIGERSASIEQPPVFVR